MDGLGQICAYVSFIVLGYVLRRVNVLKADTVHALAGLVLYVTVPCLVVVSLNGVELNYPRINTKDSLPRPVQN